LRHRYFVLTEGKVLVFQVQGPNFKQISAASVNKNADWIIAEGGGKFLFTCPGLDAMNCSEFDVDSETGALSPEGGRQIKLGAIPHRLFAIPDGRLLLVPEGKEGIHTPSEYRYNAQGKLGSVPGTGKEIPDSGNFWVYHLKSDGSIVPVHPSPFHTEHLPLSITLSPNGRFIYSGYRIYGVSRGEGVDVYSLNPDSGELRLVPDAVPISHDGSENPQTIIFGQSQGRAYGNTRNAQVIAYDADPETGHLTPRARTFLWPRVRGILSVAERSTNPINNAITPAD
jgi:hypothetical protein